MVGLILAVKWSRKLRRDYFYTFLLVQGARTVELFLFPLRLEEVFFIGPLVVAPIGSSFFSNIHNNRTDYSLFYLLVVLGM